MTKRVAQQVSAFVVFRAPERPLWAELTLTLFDNEDWAMDAPALGLRAAGDRESGGRAMTRLLLRLNGDDPGVTVAAEIGQEIVDQHEELVVLPVDRIEDIPPAVARGKGIPR